MANVVYKGAVSPEAMTLTVTASGSEDLSTVTSAVIWAKCNGKAPVNWSASIVTQSQKSITLSHVFQSGDVDVAGKMTLVAYLYIPSGLVRSKPVSLVVVDPFSQ